MTTDVRSLHEALRHAWCESLYVEVLQDGGLSITTPFLFADGDSYPILVRRVRDGWIVADEGLALSHLQLDEYELTEARLAQIARLAEAHGTSLVDRRLTLPLPDPPVAEDIADFIELLAQISGLPLHANEREGDQFRSRARDRIVGGLLRPESATTNWRPTETQGGDHFPADLHVVGIKQPVVAFFAGSSQKADRSMVSVAQYQRWGLDLSPLIAHNGSLSSETIFRAQMTLERDDAVIEVNEAATSTGYLRLMRALKDRGVEVDPAAL